MPDGVLPFTPRALREEWAALYCGMSPTLFRERVAPEVPPVRISPGRVAWLREDLDAWLDRRAGRAPASRGLGEVADAIRMEGGPQAARGRRR
jgi:predicted DNA-binding transcriptional regulator AlpA